MNRRGTAVLATGLVLATIGVDGWAWSRLSSARGRAGDATADMVRCRRLADDVLRLRDRPAIAGSHEIEITELSSRIERAAADSGIPTANVVRIAPEPARRPDRAMADGAGEPSPSGVGDADDPYLEKPTTVLLTGVTLRQLVGFLHAVGTGPAAMDVRSLRLSAPRDAEDGDRWGAEVTVSYLIYAPATPSLTHDAREPLATPPPALPPTGGRVQR